MQVIPITMWCRPCAQIVKIKYTIKQVSRQARLRDMQKGAGWQRATETYGDTCREDQWCVRGSGTDAIVGKGGGGGAVSV